MLTSARDLAMQVTVFSELFNYDIEEAKRMTKEKLALEVIDRLKKEYPDAGCTLDYDQAWKLLVSVRLAAQCTDARVNVVVEDLYAKYPDVASLAAAEPEEIEQAELYYTELEARLQQKINSMEGKYPGKDEYRYNLASIGHEPHTLISYLTAKYGTLHFRK